MLIREIRRKVSFMLRETRNNYYRFMGVKIGKNVFISRGAWLDTQDGKIIIEDGVRITNGCKVLSHDYSLRVMDKDPLIAKTIIGENSFIGMNAIILPGIKIGKKCIIGAGCVVSEDIEDYSILVGAKNRVIKKRNSLTGKWEKIDSLKSEILQMNHKYI